MSWWLGFNGEEQCDNEVAELTRRRARARDWLRSPCVSLAKCDISGAAIKEQTCSRLAIKSCVGRGLVCERRTRVCGRGYATRHALITTLDAIDLSTIRSTRGRRRASGSHARLVSPLHLNTDMDHTTVLTGGCTAHDSAEALPPPTPVRSTYLHGAQDVRRLVRVEGPGRTSHLLALFYVYPHAAFLVSFDAGLA